MHHHLAQVDRVVIQEDQSQGQRIRSFTVEAQAGTGAEWQAVATGTSVGNKRIALFQKPVTATTIRMTVTQTVGLPIVSRFSVHKPCPSS